VTLPTPLRRAIGLALAALLTSCARPHGDAAEGRWFGSVTPPHANVLRFNNDTEPETLDPGVMSGQPDQRAALLMFEGLTSPDPRTLAPRPAQAYRWEIAPDGLTYTFHLRAGLTWSDGAPVTARDFVWAWRRALSPATGSRSASLLYPLANAENFNKGVLTDSTCVGVRAADDSTLIATLAEPTAYFLFLTGYATFLPVPRQAIERWGNAWTDVGHLIGNGPFVMTKHAHGERMDFARNPRYWDAAAVKLDGVVAYAIDDLNTSTNLYKAGEIDWNPSGDIPAPFLPYLRGFADYRTGEYQATYFYCVNTTRKPFDDVHVRRALNLAIDREAIARDLLKGTRRAWGRIAPSGYPGYEPPPAVRFDPDSARRELARAGYPGGRGFPRFAILFNTSEDHRRIGEAVQAMWRRELNVPVELENQEYTSFMEATTHLHYAVARRSWIGDYLDPNTFLEPLRSGDGNNRTGWSDPRYDALLREAARTLEPAKRFALLREAEARALDAAVFLPVYHYATHELVKPYVRGLWHTALDVHPLTRVAIDREWRSHAPDSVEARR
jgi:ABC-type oligopeptide transport system substrate-binding subunit